MWAAFGRPVSPLVSPILMRRPSSRALITVDEDILSSLFPDYARESLRRPYDADTILDELILDSPELWPTTKVNPLSEEEVRDAYHWIIRAAPRGSREDTDLAMLAGLAEGLEESIRHDRSSFTATQRPCFHRRAQHLFRSLAEVSHRMRSHRIGGVLASFFRTHAAQIACVDTSDALGQWCYAILRASMREADQYECLRRVVRERPDLACRLAGKGRKAEEVIERLQLLPVQARRGRDLSPRFEDNLLLDLDRSSAFSNRRRGRSLDERVLLRGGSGRVRGSLVRGRDETEAAAEDLERAVQAHEEAAQRERRILQLTVGSRHADRSVGTSQALDLGELASLGSERMLLDGLLEAI